nr:MAG TPA: hypothetical protein [Caudoviricetes sp.]
MLLSNYSPANSDIPFYNQKGQWQNYHHPFLL